MSFGLTRGAALLLCALALFSGGCHQRPAYRVGDYLSPIGNSDPSLIIKVLSVTSDSYWLAENPLEPARIGYITRKRGEIDGRYVRVDPADFDRTKNAPPTPSPAAVVSTSTPAATPTPVITPTPTATPQPTAETHTLDLAKLAAPAQPAVVIVTVFDSSGKLLRSGTGFFVSDDGRLATTWRTVDGGANAVVKRSDGSISNVTGVLAGSTTLDLAILKADVTHAKFLVPKSSVAPDAGAHLAVIGSTLNHAEGAPVEAILTTRRADLQADILELDANLPRNEIGSPVLNENAELVGFVTTAGEKSASASSARSAGAISMMLTTIVPTAVPAWPAKAGSNGSFVAKPKPTPTPHEPRLVYTPAPSFPFWSQFSQPTATGRYLIQFDSNGQAIAVQVLQSMRNPTLDNAVIDALRRWRSEPGRAWQKSVPVIFNRPSR